MFYCFVLYAQQIKQMIVLLCCLKFLVFEKEIYNNFLTYSKRLSQTDDKNETLPLLKMWKFVVTKKLPITIQAALVIRGFSIRGFDYSRTQKPRITRENCHF